MRFLAVIGVLVCVAAVSQGFKLYSTTTPEKAPRSERIIQGWPAANDQFPHQGYLFITFDNGYAACGASLIGSRWAITAAHCLNGARYAEIRLGSADNNQSPVRITSDIIAIHPTDDLALLGLPYDVQTTDTLRPVNFARDQGQTYEGYTVTASGYGLTSDGGSTSSTLNFVNLRVISNSECAGYYGGIIVPSIICTRGWESPAQGVCSGDSGGPLVIGAGSDMLLIGVTSFVSSAGCASDGPSGFVRPNHFTGWINQVTGL